MMMMMRTMTMTTTTMMMMIIIIIDLEKVFLKLLFRGLQHFGSGIKRYIVILLALKRTISIHRVKREENQQFLGSAQLTQ